MLSVDLGWSELLGEVMVVFITALSQPSPDLRDACLSLGQRERKSEVRGDGGDRNENVIHLPFLGAWYLRYPRISACVLWPKDISVCPPSSQPLGPPEYNREKQRIVEFYILNSLLGAGLGGRKTLGAGRPTAIQRSQSPASV